MVESAWEGKKAYDAVWTMTGSIQELDFQEKGGGDEGQNSTDRNVW